MIEREDAILFTTREARRALDYIAQWRALAGDLVGNLDALQTYFSASGRSQGLSRDQGEAIVQRIRALTGELQEMIPKDF